jgi:hypothetical protein
MDLTQLRKNEEGKSGWRKFVDESRRGCREILFLQQKMLTGCDLLPFGCLWRAEKCGLSVDAAWPDERERR